MTTARIASLSRSPVHEFSKDAEDMLCLLAGFGVEGDAHGDVMAVVLTTGEIRTGDAIRVRLPEEPHRPLAPV